MPKAFTPDEKKAIRTALMEKGLTHFSKYGIRAARISDICTEVGIAKGSFYAFFPSKEDLFMTIANARDVEHKQGITTFLENAEGEPTVVIQRFFDFMMARIEGDPFLNVIKDSGEVSYLVRKIPPHLLAENAKRDKAFLSDTAELFKARFNLTFADAATLEGLLTLMLTLSMHAEFIAASSDYDAIKNLMRDLFLTRLLKGPFND